MEVRSQSSRRCLKLVSIIEKHFFKNEANLILLFPPGKTADLDAKSFSFTYPVKLLVEL